MSLVASAADSHITATQDSVNIGETGGEIKRELRFRQAVGGQAIPRPKFRRSAAWSVNRDRDEDQRIGRGVRAFSLRRAAWPARCAQRSRRPGL